jgi:hypothetical protein
MKNSSDGRVRFTTIATLGLLAGLLPAAFASARAETPEQRQACTHDAFRLCGDAMPDVARVTACLARNQAGLSPLCRSAMSGGGAATAHRVYHRAKPPQKPALKPSRKSTPKPALKPSRKSTPKPYHRH